jgi:transcriptional regulator with XRE-family HTH domain
MKSKIKIERMRKGLNQLEFAKSINLNAPTLCALENRRLVASEKHKWILEAALGIPASELFEENGLAQLE